MKKIIVFIPLLLIFFVSIGFSALETNLLIDGVDVVVRPVKNIRVTNVENPYGSNNGLSIGMDYNINNINGSIRLPSSSSSVTYTVTVTNIGTVDMGILSAIVYVNGNSNILKAEIDPSDYVLGNKLCNTSNVCNGGISKSFDVTISYKSGASVINGDIDFIATFDFRQYFTITYSGFTSTSGLDSGILTGDTKNIVFNSGNPVPSAVSVTGANGTLSNSTLTLSNVTSNVTVTRNYTITYSGFTGTTSGLLSTVPASGGTVTFDSTSGVPSSVTVSGANGTYTNSTLIITSVTGDITVTGTFSGGGGGMGTPDTPYRDEETTTYNPSDIPANSTIRYVAVSGEPQVTTDSAGKITSFEYKNPGDNGISVSNGVDTGMLAFDGNNFELLLKAKFTFSNFPSSGMAPVVNLSFLDSSNKVNGILLGGAYNSTGTAYDESSKSLSCRTSSPCVKFRLNLYSNGSVTSGIDYYQKQTTPFYSYRFSSRTAEFTFTIKIHYNNYKVTSEFYVGDDLTNPIAKLKYSTSNQSTDTYLSFTNTSNNITIQLGKWKTNDTLSFTVLQFSAVKS